MVHLVKAKYRGMLRDCKCAAVRKGFSEKRDMELSLDVESGKATRRGERTA